MPKPICATSTPEIIGMRPKFSAALTRDAQSKAAYSLLCPRERGEPVRTYGELLELAKICLLEAKLTANKDVAADMFRVAKEYRRKAAELDNDKIPDIGED